jgi:hypothetical protein
VVSSISCFAALLHAASGSLLLCGALARSERQHAAEGRRERARADRAQKRTPREAVAAEDRLRDRALDRVIEERVGVS